MSRQLLSHSPDLQRLRDEGYEIDFRSGMLAFGVPYVNRAGEVARGYLVSSLEAEGDHTAVPTDHTVYFVGATQAPDDQPCDSAGQPLVELMNQPTAQLIASDMQTSCQFSQKPQPTGQYVDYHDKMTTYAAMLHSHVLTIDPDAKIPTFLPMATEEGESVHMYFDSATSRARIGVVSDKTKHHKIAIIGLGGTGSFVLDALTKTHVAEIHLYDGDEMKTHNAFRAPGAMTLEELAVKPLKVDHHQRTYAALHRYVVAHPNYISDENVEELRGMGFVFICIDGGAVKKVLVEKLQEFGVPFIDTGMDIEQTGDSLGGILRTTRILPGQVDPRWVQENLSFAEVLNDDYDQNIQISELNMLNAALAVIAWKKHIGFYRDYINEIESDYTIDGNLITKVPNDED